MKYIEISKMTAKANLKCGLSVTIAIFNAKNNKFITHYTYTPTYQNESLEDVETLIIQKLITKHWYYFKYFERWE